MRSALPSWAIADVLLVLYFWWGRVKQVVVSRSGGESKK